MSDQNSMQEPDSGASPNDTNATIDVDTAPPSSREATRAEAGALAQGDTSVDAAAAATEHKVVYVEAPMPPRKKGNRGIGSLIALLSAVIFAALFVIVALLSNPQLPIADFLASPTFYFPVLFFAVGFVLLVLLINNASWWAHVIGSIFVGLFVYFGSIGALLLVGGIVLQTAESASAIFQTALVSPVMIAAALLSRELALWMGALISARGRRVKSKNTQARDAFEREAAEKKAEYERISAAHTTAV